MPTLIHRLNQLEKRTNGKGRCIVVQTGCGHTAKDVAQALEAHQVYQTPSDTVVYLKTIYQDRNGSDLPALGPPLLLSVTP